MAIRARGGEMGLVADNSARKDEIAKLAVEMRQEAAEWRGFHPTNSRVARRLDHYADRIEALTSYEEERTPSGWRPQDALRLLDALPVTDRDGDDLVDLVDVRDMLTAMMRESEDGAGRTRSV
jgi:hypothetical protein